MSDLPPGWAEERVSDLLEHDIGGVWGKPPGEDEVDVRVIRVADFRDDGVASLSSAPLRSVTARQLVARESRAGDVLLEKSGGGPHKPVGRVVRVLPHFEPVIPTNFVQLIRPAPSVIEPGYLFWWLWHSHAIGAAATFQRATTNIRNLRTQDYLSQPAPVPPLNEQRRIVAAIEEHLSRLDAADASLAAALRRLDALRTTSVTSGNGSWPVEPLGDIAHTTSGGTPSRKRADYYGGAIPWVKSGELGDGRVSRTEETITELGLAESSAKVFPRGTLLIALYGATIGKLGLLEIDAATNQAVCAITPKESIDVSYLWHVLRQKRPELVAAGQGGAQPNISQSILRRVLVPVPPLEEQRRIVQEVEERLSRIDAMRESIERAQHRSKSLRAAILERAFRGELVPQDPSDERAEALLARIRAERASSQR